MKSGFLSIYPLMEPKSMKSGFLSIYPSMETNSMKSGFLSIHPSVEWLHPSDPDTECSSIHDVCPFSFKLTT